MLGWLLLVLFLVRLILFRFHCLLNSTVFLRLAFLFILFAIVRTLGLVLAALGRGISLSLIWLGSLIIFLG